MSRECKAADDAALTGGKEKAAVGGPPERARLGKKPSSSRRGQEGVSRGRNQPLTSAAERAKQWQRAPHGGRGEEMYGRVTEEGEEQAYALLGSHHMARQGLEVKLDRGFATGSYAVWVEYDQLAARVGFAAARRLAREYCTLLKSQVSQVSQYRPGKIDDLSQSDDPRRQRDLEGTFLSFVIKTDDGRYHDDAMRKDFQRALLRTGQAWDQAQAKRRDQGQSAGCSSAGRGYSFRK
jgi:hypothetical protein